MDPALAETVDFLRTRCRQRPALGLILGTGLGVYADSFRDRISIPYGSIPRFPRPTVAGHPGNLVMGSVMGISCIALQGRVHLYEGYSMQDIAFPVRLLGRLGISRLIVTNAAGGLNPDFRPGDLMVIEDHINMMGSNPLIGTEPEEPEVRFPDMSDAYEYISPSLRAQEGWDFAGFSAFGTERITGARLVSIDTASPGSGTITATVDYYVSDGYTSRESVWVELAPHGDAGQVLMTGYEVLDTTRIG